MCRPTVIDVALLLMLFVVFIGAGALIIHLFESRKK